MCKDVQIRGLRVRDVVWENGVLGCAVFDVAIAGLARINGCSLVRHRNGAFDTVGPKTLGDRGKMPAVVFEDGQLRSAVSRAACQVYKDFGGAYWDKLPAQGRAPYDGWMRALGARDESELFPFEKRNSGEDDE